MRFPKKLSNHRPPGGDYAHTAKMSGRAFGVLAVIAGAGLSTLAITAALAAGGHGSHAYFSIFAHHPRLRLSHAAAAANPHLPPGAILASVSESNGVRTEVYAWQKPNGDFCVLDLQVGKAGGAACSRPAAAKADGVEVSLGEVGGTTASVAVLLPDGVSTAVAGDRDGSTRSLRVTNNVGQITDPNLSSVSYKMPDGTRHTSGMPHLPKHPGPVSNTSG